MDLELIQNRNDLIYEKEYNFNTKPLEIDLLVIKKDRSAHISNEIGYLFKGHKFSVTNPYRGIYYIEGQLMFPVQIIVTGELDKKYHKWLSALSGQLQKDNIQELLDSRNNMTQKADMELADSILEVCIGANRHVIEELMEDDSMYEVLMEIMEPKIKLREDKIQKEAQRKIQEVRKEDIQGTISILRNLNIENSKIKSEIVKAYKLSESEAEEYL